MADSLPPLPDGFTLDSSPDTVPPLPPGFHLDSPSKSKPSASRQSLIAGTVPPTVESETLQHGPISRFLDILPQLVYDFTIGPFDAATRVFGRPVEEHRQALTSMTPDERALFLESPPPTPLQTLSAPPGTYSDQEVISAMTPLTSLGLFGALGTKSVGGVPMGIEKGFLSPDFYNRFLTKEPASVPSEFPPPRVPVAALPPAPALQVTPEGIVMPRVLELLGLTADQIRAAQAELAKPKVEFPTAIAAKAIPSELQAVINGEAPAFLNPPASEGTIPTAGEQVLQGMDLKKVAGQTGMGYFKGRDGTEVVFNPDLTKTSALKVLDKQGKLPEIVNGPGTSPKPAVPTDAVVVRSPDGTEIRTILTNTPEKTAAAVQAQPPTTQVEVKPATEAIPQIIQDRMQAIRAQVEDVRTSIPTGKQFYRDQEGNIIKTGAAKSIREYLSGDFPELRDLPNVGPKEIVQAIDKDRGNKLYLQIKDAVEHQMTREAANPETVVTRPPDFEEFSRAVDELAAQEKAAAATSGTTTVKQPWEMTVQRIEEKGAPDSSVSKPHGLYTSPADVESPHASLGGTSRRLKTNPQANVLVLPEMELSDPSTVMRKGALSGSSGVVTAKQLLGSNEFNRLKSLSKSQLIQEAEKIDPSVEWSRYFDRQEIMEGIGGVLARKHGYDAIWSPDKLNPAFSEYIGLTDNAFSASRVSSATQPQLFQTQATMPPEGLQAKMPQVEHGDLLEGFKPPEAQAPELPLQAKPPSEPPPTPIADYGVIAKGIADSINQSFAPMQSAAGRISAIRNGFKTIFAANKTSEPAERFFAGWREMRGSAQLEVSRAEGAMQSAVDYFDKLPQQDRVAFGSRIALHEAQPNPEMRVLAENYRKLMDRGWAALDAVGETSNYLEDYFGTMWKNSSADIQRVYSQLPRRPIGGRPGFQYKKFYLDWKDGIDKGLQPVTYNPIKMGLLKYGEMINYAEAARFRNALIDEGVLQPIFAGEKAPYGYQILKGRLWAFKGSVEPPSLGEGPKIAQPGGHWAVPDEVARLVDYVESASLTKNAYTGQFFNWLRGVTNTSNIMKMGLSGFHYFTTMKNEIGAEAAIAAVRAARGEFPDAIMALAKTPISPLTGFRAGGQIAAEYIKPGSSPQYAQVVDWMRIANIKPKQWEAYTNQHLEQVKEAWKNGELATIAKQGLPAMVEYTSKFLMRRWIPQLSFSMFKDVVTVELSKLPSDADYFLVQKTLQRVADQVQNRMGQITQENLPWHQYTKDLSHAVMAFPLWNIGNVRSISAGIMDLAKIQRSVTAKGIDIPETVIFPAVLTTMVGLLGGLKHWNNTGQPPWEDYNGSGFWVNSFKPGDGEGGRLNQAWMFRDFLPPPRRLSNVLVMLRNKAIGPISAFGQFAMNDDFHGGLVYDPTSSPLQQAMDIAKNTSRVLYEPIAVNSALRLLEKGITPSEAIYKAITGETPVGRSGLTPEEEDALFQRRYRKQIFRLQQGRHIPGIN